MADRVPKITQAERPTFDARAYCDRLQETRTADGALAPAQAFDKAKPSSIVSLAEFVRGKLTDTVNALTDFTAAHQLTLTRHETLIGQHDSRLDVLEAARSPFGSGSG